jgi:sec-independent protein translocase protein TatA
MVGIGLTEGIVIIVAILVLFGATRLPKLGKGIGEGLRNFKTGLKGDETPEDVDSPKSKDDPKSDAS